MLGKITGGDGNMQLNGLLASFANSCPDIEALLGERFEKAEATNMMPNYCINFMHILTACLVVNTLPPS